VTRVVARGGRSRRMMAAGVAAALGLLATTAFGEDSTLAEGARVFKDQGCYGCHTIGKSGMPIALDLSPVGS